MPELSDGYHVTRRRVGELVADLGEDDIGRRVPACPDWTVHDLVAHVSGIPESLAAGDGPAGDLQAWLDAMVEDRRRVPVTDLLDRWDACAETASAIVDGSGGQLFIDLVSHEHDLRGALRRPGARGAAEVRASVQLYLDLLAPAIAEAGLGSLMVDSGGVRWASQFARPGATLRIDPWEAIRVLQSRRTAEEILTLPATGDVAPYVAIIEGHSPLPKESLHE